MSDDEHQEDHAAVDAAPSNEYPKMATSLLSDGRIVPLVYKAPHPKTGELVVFEDADEENAFKAAHADPKVGLLDTSNYHPDSAAEK